MRKKCGEKNTVTGLCHPHESGVKSFPTLVPEPVPGGPQENVGASLTKHLVLLINNACAT